jgi:hypothetical protein
MGGRSIPRRIGQSASTNRHRHPDPNPHTGGNRRIRPGRHGAGQRRAPEHAASGESDLERGDRARSGEYGHGDWIAGRFRIDNLVADHREWPRFWLGILAVRRENDAGGHKHAHPDPDACRVRNTISNPDRGGFSDAIANGNGIGIIAISERRRRPCFRATVEPPVHREHVGRRRGCPD